MASSIGQAWYEQFNRLAGDLYPGRYTPSFCNELAEEAERIRAIALEKRSVILAHNYLYPELHEVADYIGDSLGLSFEVKGTQADRIDFESVYFMGETAKMIVGDSKRVFVPDRPTLIGCSLVFGTDHAWLRRWKEAHPNGIVLTYINSDAYTKSLSDFVTTSRNTDKIIAHVLRAYPGRRILVMPDKYLGFVMKARALELLRNEGVSVDPDLIEIYQVKKSPWNAACYVHEKIGEQALDLALLENPDAEVMIHPECGCASSCLLKLDQGIIPRGRAYFLSTQQMIGQAKRSLAKRFIVATEKGMIYRLRKEVPEKEFVPVSDAAECGFMKECTLPKLRRSLEADRLEIMFCDDCCDPEQPFSDDGRVHLGRSVAKKAMLAVERMMAIKESA